MNLTEKYNIIMKYNQMGHNVPENYQDFSEKIATDFFEKCVVELKNKNKKTYNMMELGSNYSYYSMLFKKILEPSETFNLLLEPYPQHMEMGKEHFKINNLEGIFLEEKIFNPNPPVPWCNIELNCPSTTVDDLLERYDIDELDVIHCDLDGSEVCVLDGSEKSLKNKKIDTLFIMTHALDSEESSLCESTNVPTKLHLQVKDRLLSYGYNLIYDHEKLDLGFDSMLVFKR